MADPQSARIVMITAGAGGMYCGSCLQDNALAASLTKAGIDVQLVPTYTPLRTDQADQSADRVFFGGINVYLQQQLPLWGSLPAFLVRWLDHPTVIRWATARGMNTNAGLLGELTLSMLRGHGGRQRVEVERLVGWLQQHARPDLIHFSNVLISGAAASIKQQLGTPILVTLQGDDLFLDGLPLRYQDEALRLIRQIDSAVDGYLVHSDFYGEYMANYLGVERAKFHKIPLAIAAGDLIPGKPKAATETPTIGYLARIAPEKGLHLLCDAFRQLRADPATANVRLLIAGWLGNDQQEYAQRQFTMLSNDCGADSFEYRGCVSRAEKRQLLSEIDVLSVPTTMAEPKGLYVLEALAMGCPVVQPSHGIFPEIMAATGGGLLCDPNDPASLSDQLRRLLVDPQRRQELGSLGRQKMLKHFTAEVAAGAVSQLYGQLLGRNVGRQDIG